MQYVLFIALLGWLLYKLSEPSVPVSRKPEPVQKPAVLSPTPVKPTVPVVKYKPEYGDWLWVHNNPGIHPFQEPVRKVAEWFIDKWVKDLAISPAEQLIINALEDYDIKWYREVSFVDMPKTDKGANYRFDFYIPSAGIVIEYNSKLWHSDPVKVCGDRLKEKFCRDNSIRYIALESAHYYHMAFHIEEIMEELGAKRYA